MRPLAILFAAVALLASAGAGAAGKGFLARCGRSSGAARLYCKRGESAQRLRQIKTDALEAKELIEQAAALESQAAGAQDSASAQGAAEVAQELKGLKKDADEFLLRQQADYERATYELAEDANNGNLGLAWVAGGEPKRIGPNEELTTKTGGLGISLWDGSETRLAPNSKLLMEGCKPCQPCKHALKAGTVHVASDQGFMSFQKATAKDPCAGADPASRPEAAPPAASAEAGAGGPADSGAPPRAPRLKNMMIATAALTLIFSGAQVVAHTTEKGKTSVAVIKGQVEAKTPEGESVTLKAGETLQAEPGQPLDMPQTADMSKLDTWWEEVE